MKKLWNFFSFSSKIGMMFILLGIIISLLENEFVFSSCVLGLGIGWTIGSM